ncbi:hypothetical protein [Nonomuraea sp. NPDC001699]
MIAERLPRLLRLPDGSTRTHGPLFLAERRPVPGRRPTAGDICPHIGRARLGYDRAPQDAARRSIRRRYAENEVSLADLAAEYSVGRSTIHRIIHGPETSP